MKSVFTAKVKFNKVVKAGLMTHFGISGSEVQDRDNALQKAIEDHLLQELAHLATPLEQPRKELEVIEPEDDGEAKM